MVDWRIIACQSSRTYCKARHLTLHLPQGWPWENQFNSALARLRALRRMLPADFPDWRTCYKYFRQWSERPDPAKYSILEQVLKKSVDAARSP